MLEIVFGGFLVPLIPLGLSIAAAISGRAQVMTGYSRGASTEIHLNGATAYAWALTCFGLAVFLHCHYFWAATRPNSVPSG